jgi:hypothetical protein
MFNVKSVQQKPGIKNFLHPTPDMIQAYSCHHNFPISLSVAFPCLPFISVIYTRYLLTTHINMPALFEDNT